MRPSIDTDEDCGVLEPNSFERSIGYSTDPSKRFLFDHVLGPNASQAVVYRTIGAPIVHDVMHGVHGCIIAYGQTGAGKTFSLMDLSHGRLGLIPRALHEIFDRIEHAEPHRSFVVRMSYLQIYMEQIYDLLVQTGERLEVREHPSKELTVEGLSEHRVESVAEVIGLLEKGARSKMVSQTRLNQHSSRSHCLLDIHIESIDESREPVRRLRSKLSFVDLAGSERAGKAHLEGIQLEEAKNINLSLSSLGNVIAALATAEGAAHRGKVFVPWRDSKLTRLLQNTLGGKSRTALLINVRPDNESLQESTTSLMFGQRAMEVLVDPLAHPLVDYKALASELQGTLDAVTEHHAQLCDRAEVEKEALLLENQALEEELGSLRGVSGEMIGMQELHANTMAELEQYQELCLEAAQQTADISDENTEYALKYKTLLEDFNRQSEAHGDAEQAWSQERERILSQIEFEGGAGRSKHERGGGERREEAGLTARGESLPPIPRDLTGSASTSSLSPSHLASKGPQGGGDPALLKEVEVALQRQTAATMACAERLGACEASKEAYKARARALEGEVSALKATVCLLKHDAGRRDEALLQARTELAARGRAAEDAVRLPRAAGASEYQVGLPPRGEGAKAPQTARPSGKRERSWSRPRNSSIDPPPPPPPT